MLKNLGYWVVFVLKRGFYLNLLIFCIHIQVYKSVFLCSGYFVFVVFVVFVVFLKKKLKLISKNYFLKILLVSWLFLLFLYNPKYDDFLKSGFHTATFLQFLYKSDKAKNSFLVVLLFLFKIFFKKTNENNKTTCCGYNKNTTI